MVRRLWLTKNLLSERKKKKKKEKALASFEYKSFSMKRLLVTWNKLSNIFRCCIEISFSLYLKI